MSRDQSERALSRPFCVSLLVVLLNACVACLSKTGATILLSAPASSQTVKVDVSMSNQTLEGWGTSLAWFANSVGSWTNTTNQNNLMNALFSQTSGLGLNYLRYNIGGGDDALCGTGNQHYACITPWVATHAQSLGTNLFEAVSYSPPYWMTNSGTSEDGVNGADNLASGYYGSGSGTFAGYFTTVAQYFISSFIITFHHLDPFN